ncbi:MAG: YhbY family RNA-binding protein [archaeon]
MTQLRFEATFQIGKAGLTPGVVESLSLAFKTHKQVRISVLKASSSHNKEGMRKLAVELSDNLAKRFGGNYRARIIGFTIILRKSSAKV